MGAVKRRSSKNGPFDKAQELRHAAEVSNRSKFLERR